MTSEKEFFSTLEKDLLAPKLEVFLEDFTSKMEDPLGSCVNSILGFMTFVFSDPSNPSVAKFKENSETLWNKAERGRVILYSLTTLMFMKISHKKLEPVEINVRELAEKEISYLQSLSNHYDIHFENGINETFKIVIDKTNFRYLIQNTFYLAAVPSSKILFENDHNTLIITRAPKRIIMENPWINRIDFHYQMLHTYAKYCEISVEMSFTDEDALESIRLTFNNQ